ncbi:MAG: membrane protein insertion efficiency factor YidD [Spirochaetales bacterium]|nr:membrane protein insertion efficiency factor YidD [Spirochaetales bacterium]MCF7939649.1 membrane protein insertion efficiency factor YidD [Spirochaetales bacterium]
MKGILYGLSMALRWLVTVPIHLYRFLVSPLLPDTCIYTPTCSHYAVDAVMKHGIFKGLLLALTRISRCTGGFFTGGEDPVPEQFSFHYIRDSYRRFRPPKKDNPRRRTGKSKKTLPKTETLDYSRNMKKKTILVTGSTDGIGKETARLLSEAGHRVIIHGRSEDRAKQAAQEISPAENSSLAWVYGDYSQLEQVRSLARQVLEAVPRLDVLINNAGIQRNDYRQTADGFEETFQVNHLAPFLLTNLLLERVKASAPARIVTVSSMIHASSLDLGNLNGGKSFDGREAYSRSKLCNVLFTYALDRRLEGTGVTANCLHPGVIGTKLLRAGFGGGGGPVSEGAQTSVYLALSEEVENVSGKYFRDKQENTSHQISYDRELQEKLWSISAGMTELNREPG